MTVSIESFMADFTPEERARVDARTEELIEEQLTLRDLRQARNLTQERMARLMGVEQENVSRLERRADLLLSTLSNYVTAMGGKLRLVAEFPNRRPIAIGLGDIVDDQADKLGRRDRAALKDKDPPSTDSPARSARSRPPAA
jgi:transcriptional regulator with XRE-family HTH domain